MGGDNFVVFIRTEYLDEFLRFIRKIWLNEKHEFDDGEMTLCSYDIYFFDMQTNILYFFHNNI